MKLEILTKSENNSTQRKIISELRDYIVFKNLEPGDKIPSERMLAERFKVSRSNIREAIQRLEFFGILKSKPQSGTFVADIGRVAMRGMLDDILRLEDPDFKSLVETRILLELKLVQLASERRTEEDLQEMKSALEAYEEKVNADQEAVEEDLLFHLAIAKASRNATMNTFMLIITPEIITNFEKYHVCDSNLSRKGIQEHRDIFNAIEKQDTKLARQKMKDHFSVLYQYCYQTK